MVAIEAIALYKLPSQCIYKFQETEEKIDEFLYSWVSYLGNLFTKCAYDYPICKLFSSFTERVLRMVDATSVQSKFKTLKLGRNTFC